MRKAQTVTEFSIIFAVIIIILIAIVSISARQLSGTSGTKNSIKQKMLTQYPIGIAATGVSATGCANLTLINNEYFDVNVIQLYISTVLVINGTPGGAGPYADGVTIPSSTQTLIRACNLPVTQGSEYTLPISINYMDTATQMNYSQSGNDYALVGVGGQD